MFSRSFLLPEHIAASCCVLHGLRLGDIYCINQKHHPNSIHIEYFLATLLLFVPQTDISIHPKPGPVHTLLATEQGLRKACGASC